MGQLRPVGGPIEVRLVGVYLICSAYGSRLSDRRPRPSCAVETGRAHEAVHLAMRTLVDPGGIEPPSDTRQRRASGTSKDMSSSAPHDHFNCGRLFMALGCRVAKDMSCAKDSNFPEGDPLVAERREPRYGDAKALNAGRGSVACGQSRVLPGASCRAPRPHRCPSSWNRSSPMHDPRPPGGRRRRCAAGQEYP